MSDRQTRNASAQRICVALHDLSGGGTERIAIRLANRWAELGRSVRLFCGSTDGPLRSLIGSEVSLRYISPPVRRGRGARSWLSRAIAELLRDEPADLLFLPGNYHFPLAESAAGLPSEVRPTIVAQLSNPLRRATRGPVRQFAFDWLTRRRLRHIGFAIALTTAAGIEADEVLRRRISHVIPLPALEDAAPLPSPTPRGSPLVLAIGRLAKQKDFKLAIEAFSSIRTTDATLAILGEGPERRELEHLIERLGIAHRVNMPGYVPDVRHWLDRARCLVVSSRFEGYNAAVVEALAAGRPVVAVPCGGAVSELITTPEVGLVAKTRSVRDLAGAMDQLLGCDPAPPHKIARSTAPYRIGPGAEMYLRVFDQARCKAA